MTERYEIQPLINLVGSKNWLAAVEALTGVSRRQLHRFVHDGVPWYTADLIACRMQLHPGLIWPEWWYEEVLDGLSQQV